MASETCAVDAIGAKFIREVEPGEIVRLDKNGLHSRFFVRNGEITPAHCIFEHVYFSKQNSRIFGENVHEFRKKLGRQLAKEHPVEADVVIPVPDSGTSAAIGYAEQSGIPFDMGLVRSHYIGRTFISPDQKLRELEVKLKLAIIKEVVARQAGRRGGRFHRARHDHPRQDPGPARGGGQGDPHAGQLPADPVPVLLRRGFPDEGRAAGQQPHAGRRSRTSSKSTASAICRWKGMLSCASLPEDHYCTACWAGKYPIPVDITLNKFCMERYQLYMFEGFTHRQ